MFPQNARNRQASVLSVPLGCIPSIEYQSLTGRGATARIDGHEYFVGNHRFAHELGVSSGRIEQKLAKLEGQGQSVIVVGHTPHNGCVGEVLGSLASVTPFGRRLLVRSGGFIASASKELSC